MARDGGGGDGAQALLPPRDEEEEAGMRSRITGRIARLGLITRVWPGLDWAENLDRRRRR
jgi:hypothetical protein